MLEDNKFYKAYKRHEKFYHFIEGILIICLILSLNVYLYKDHQIKKEINQNCGWAEEDYRCYCQYNTVNDIEINLGNVEYYINLSDGEVLEHPEGEYDVGWEAYNVSLDG